MNKLNKGMLFSVAVLSLSACGGGSDGGDAGTTGGGTGGYEEPTVTVTTSHGSPSSKSSVDEGEILTINVDVNGGKGAESLSASVTRKNENHPLPEKKSINNGFSFKFAEVPYRQQDYTITVTAQKGAESVSEKLDVSAYSLKGEAVYEFASTVNTQLPAQRQFIAEWLMIERLVKGINLAGGDIDIKDIKPLYVQATSGEGFLEDSLFSVYTNEPSMTNYENSDARWDLAFQTLLEGSSADSCSPPRCFNSHLIRVKPMFDYVFDRSDGVISKPSYGEASFDRRTGTYSIFYVAPDNGSFDENGVWTFKPEYGYLKDIIIAGNEAAKKFSEAE